MADRLMDIVRRHNAAPAKGEVREKREKSPTIEAGTQPFTPLNPLLHHSTGEPWNQAAAMKLMTEAESLFARMGVSGFHPDVQAAAAMVASAYATLDMETVRFACSEFVAAVRVVSTVSRA